MTASQVTSTNLITTRRADPLTVAFMAKQRARRIGARMRERREELGLKQREVAERVGIASVTGTYVSRWERGEHEPQEDYLDAIAEALETTVADLIGGPAETRANGATPDVIASFNGGGDEEIAARLANIEASLARIERAVGAEPASEGPLEGPGEGPLLPDVGDEPTSSKAGERKARRQSARQR